MVRISSIPSVEFFSDRSESLPGVPSINSGSVVISGVVGGGAGGGSVPSGGGASSSKLSSGGVLNDVSGSYMSPLCRNDLNSESYSVRTPGSVGDHG